MRTLITTVAVVALLAAPSATFGDDTGASVAEADCHVGASSAASDIAPDPSPTASPLPADVVATAQPCTGRPGVTDVLVEAGDLWFDPTEIRLPAGGMSTITLVNGGFVTHNLTVDELDLLIAVARGRAASVVLDPPPAGAYAFYCSISGHREAGMEGVLIVE